MECAINFAQFLITETSPSHTCFQHWNGFSAAMETDIIVKGFKNCEQPHNMASDTFPSLVMVIALCILASCIEAVPCMGVFN